MRKALIVLASAGLVLTAGCGPKLTDEEKNTPPPAVTSGEQYRSSGSDNAPPAAAAPSSPAPANQGEGE